MCSELVSSWCVPYFKGVEQVYRVTSWQYSMIVSKPHVVTNNEYDYETYGNQTRNGNVQTQQIDCI